MNRSSDLRDFGIKEQFKPNFKNAPRDGPSDIQGGGWDFSSRPVIFFSLFAQQVIFFKSKLQQIFYFFEKITQ